MTCTNSFCNPTLPYPRLQLSHYACYFLLWCKLLYFNCGQSRRSWRDHTLYFILRYCCSKKLHIQDKKKLGKTIAKYSCYTTEKNFWQKLPKKLDKVCKWLQYCAGSASTTSVRSPLQIWGRTPLNIYTISCTTSVRNCAEN